MFDDNNEQWPNRRKKHGQDEALAAFLPGRGKNTLLRLAANALGIALVDEQPEDVAGNPQPMQAGMQGKQGRVPGYQPSLSWDEPDNDFPEAEPGQPGREGGLRAAFEGLGDDARLRQPGYISGMGGTVGTGWGERAPVIQAGYRRPVDRNNASGQPAVFQPQQQPFYTQNAVWNSGQAASYTPKTIAQKFVDAGLMNLPPSPQLTEEQEFSQVPYEYDKNTGRTLKDIDGREIHPDAVIVGRAFHGQDNVALSDSNTDNIIEKVTGHPVFYMDPNDPYKYGVYNTEYKGIGINSTIDKELQGRVKKHEMGHMLDDFGGKIYDGVDSVPEDTIKELKEIYNIQRNPDLNQDKSQVEKVSPESYGTPQSAVRAELIAEALRAYLTDPNAMKAQYPISAKYLRDYINTNPHLNKYIHLSDNSESMNVAPSFLLAKKT